ncbi:MAG: nicotinamide-nucleotide amidohydrolase family protein [Gammaproteobacteria bacterium]|jgi:nicotinamide-nucleotide amidase|nr:nicotinamide-nucleotide amidohydrolase family protein [Gammaproteobacteria bacterium]HJP34485.1 nicotinamide-nucleotide amidohydrolase family protein [Gammaproteobacteria bacterium]
MIRRDPEELESNAYRLGEALRAQGMRMATAESCTGGWIAQTATAIPGSSDWFDRGYVTYSNRAKIQVLGVSERTLETYGAVSAQTVSEMVVGALVAAGVEVAVAVTGVAGPDGGTKEKPVGTVWFGWCLRNRDPVTRVTHFEGDRRSVRAQTVAVALDGLRDLICAAGAP